MTTLATAISSAVTKSLLSNLPAETATKFGIDQDEYKEFLQTFLTNQLKATKATRSGPKGKNGKGRISGYILFSNEHRDAIRTESPDLKFTEVGKVLGKKWSGLSDDERAEWNAKAVAQNEANGIPAATPTPAKKAAGKKAATKPTAKPAAKAGEMKISRHQGSKAWVVQGTNFVVKSPKNKVVVGKLKGTKVVALNAADRKTCKESGFEVEAKTTKK